MYKSKREVDKFVKDLSEKYRSDNDRSLKGITIAKLYFNIGEFSQAISFLDKYDVVRKNSSQSLKLRGQIYQAQSASADSGEKCRLQSQALKSYRQSVELDLSQTDLLLVIAELMLYLPIEEHGKARYWLEQAENVFPQNKTIKRLREKIKSANEGIAFEDIHPDDVDKEELNGNGGHGDSDDNSAFWSATTGGGTSFLNNSIVRLDVREETTSTPRLSGASQARRFVPRPSPERLATQVRNLEGNQEKLLAYIQESNRSLIEVNEAILKEISLTRVDFVKSVNEQVNSNNTILNEMRGLKEETGRQLRDNTRALKDVKSELVNLCEDMMRQLKTLVSTLRASKDEVDEEKKPSAKLSEPTDLNEILLQHFARLPPVQQLAMLQMSTHFPTAAILPAMLPTVASSTLPGLPIIQASQIPAGIGNTPGPPIFDLNVAQWQPTFGASQLPAVTQKEVPVKAVTPKPVKDELSKTPSSSFLSNEKTTTASFGFSTPSAPQTFSVQAFSFAGAAAEAAQRAIVTEENDDHVHDESAEHDPHFEPIVPLPELVEVKTGEEEEIELFANKAKVYRYDSGSKEWKERGVGILKILKHSTKGTYRVLLRREQVHKIAANHMITKDIELKPLNNSPNAVCYHAMDFSEESLKLEQLAVRVKLEETMIEFKKVFKECQDALKDTKSIENSTKEMPTNQKDISSLDKFKPKAGSWECGGCWCRNEANVTCCPSCFTPKPGHENEAKNRTNFASEGTPGKFSLSSGTSPSSGFKFGIPASSTAATEPSQQGFKFGGTSSSGSIFGGKPTNVSPGVSMFGGKVESTATNTPIFGNNTLASSTPFESKSAETSKGVFGVKSNLSGGFSFGSTTTSGPGIFASPLVAPSQEPKPSVFSSFSFGGSTSKSQDVKRDEGESGVDLSASKNLNSFADLATSSKGFGFGNSQPTTFSFFGSGAPVFSSSKPQQNDDDGCNEEVENDHDPHFEPIVPLPELVQVKTGEEDETELFNSRGKIYRYDPDTKDWKERGLGNVKVLKHPKNLTFRVLLRREQVHKIAVNHMITKDMELKPMLTSNTAVCYYAMDFADETLKLEHLAVKFKLEETLEQFKKVFRDCQEELRKKPATNKVEVVDKCLGLKDEVNDLVNLDKFKPTPGSWECPDCCTNNEASELKCLCCQAPKAAKDLTPPTISATSSAEVKVTCTSNPDELSFENQSLKLDSAQEALAVAELIKAHQDMKTLTLSGNTIGINAAEVIGNSLKTHPEFKRAHWKDMFTGRSKTEIPPALKHLSNGILMANAQLVELDLSDNAFGPIGMDGIAELLKSPSCFTLQELRLNNTGCGITGGKLLAKTLMECYENSGNKLALKVFVLGRSRQENDGATALAEIFKVMGSLEEVVMPQNGIYHQGIAALADAFSSNKNLRILNMNDNTFTEKGAQALAKALPNLQKLEVLNLGDCLLKTKGAKVIAEGLQSGHFGLKELNFESNEIRLPGGQSIVDAIANKPNIEMVNLNGNQFGKEGCKSIIVQLEKIGKTHAVKEIKDDEEEEDNEEDESEGEGEEEEEEEDDEEVDDAQTI